MRLKKSNGNFIKVIQSYRGILSMINPSYAG